jgi:stearoyl-CoA desaturase (delta-9 desaturase)
MTDGQTESTTPIGRRSGIALRLLWVIPAATVLVPFLAMLSAPFVLLLFGIRTQDIVAFLIFYCLVMLGITLGYHRTLAHKSLTLVLAARYPVLALGAMGAQGPPSFWVAHHRAHHGDPDGPRDPHSPLTQTPSGSSAARRFLHAHVGWMFGHGGRYDGRLVRDLRKDPAARGIERHYSLLVVSGLIFPALLVLPFDPSGAGLVKSLYWAGLVRVGVSHQTTWLVNSACHLWGYRNFRTSDSSRNNWLVAILTLGEGWHNNHHADPARAHHGIRHWELDPTFSVARLLVRMGLAGNLRQ